MLRVSTFLIGILLSTATLADYTIQIASASNLQRAQALQQTLANEHISTVIDHNPYARFFKIALSQSFDSVAKANVVLVKLKTKFPSAYVINRENTTTSSLSAPVAQNTLKPSLAPTPSVTPEPAPTQSAVPPNKEAPPGEVRFNIDQFKINGNSLVSTETIQAVVKPFTGKQKNFGDLQKAIEHIEAEYQKTGFSAVNVFLPEQELGNGSVTINVIEGKLTKISVEGAEHHNDENVLAAFPALKLGMSPNLKEISANTLLANENGSKKGNVAIAVGDEDGALLATVKVKDESPTQWMINADNSGNRSTGQHRIGAIFQHHNLFDKDHTLTMGYTTSPERLDDVKIYSMGYRIPLYRMGDSIDLMCGYSDVTGSQTLLAGTTSMSMNFVGKGKLCGAKYNYLLGRDGEVTSRVIFGVDYKDFDRVVANINGAQIPSPGYQLYPLSVTYLRQLQRPGLGVDTNVSLIQNVGSDANTIQGVLNSSEDAVSNPAMRARTTNPDYRIVKAGVSLLTLLNDNAWQWRNSLNLQRASDPLVGAEQMGMGGSMTVRGLPEREFGTDDGIIFTSEVTLTDLKKTFELEGNLFPVVFVDHAQGSNQGFNSNTTTQTERVSATSAGLGLRYALDKDLFLKVDLGRVLALDAKTYTGTQAQGTLDGEVGKEYKSFYEGTWRAHASFMARF